MVGAVLVYEDRIIGEGYHERYGEAHAEVNCILSVKENERPLIEHSIMYVSLEPCCHHGKTPPCTDFIIQHRIQKVVIGCKDISAKVNGAGIDRLRTEGIEVIEHILEPEAIDLNKRFFTFHRRKRPYILLKWAQSKEGYIGSPIKRIKLSDDITNQMVHQWRAEEDAIWVGFNTAKIDNPLLSVRYTIGRNPTRILYDRTLDLDEQSFLFDQTQATLVFNHILESKAINRHLIKINPEHPIEQILTILHDQHILSVLVEGGRNLIGQLIELNVWDEARLIETDVSLKEGIRSPILTNHHKMKDQLSGMDVIHFYKNGTLL